MLQTVLTKSWYCYIRKLNYVSRSYLPNIPNHYYSTKRELDDAYKPSIVESNNQAARVEAVTSGNRDGHRFSLLLPPPNVTGDLHLGHALTGTIQDVLIRHKQKQGFETLWIPGMDHAGIATQVVVEKKLQKERQLSRHDLGREKFLAEIWAWKNDKAKSIKHDLCRLGNRMDWEREYFTMDEQQSKAVKEAFVRLFEAGLIYRDKSLVNWSCALESAISDIEVDSIEINGPTAIEIPGYQKKVMFGEMVDIAYKVQGRPEEIVISTTRPETLLGDVAVAVNPTDSRYEYLRNNRTMLWHPIRREEIPLIFDESVDPEFGTGAVKITPAHDRYDYDIAKKHHLPLVEVINSKGMIHENLGPFSKLSRYEARSKMMDYLANQSLLRRVMPHSMILPICSRSKDVIEFLLRPQWFVRCQQMARRAKEAVESGELQMIPNGFEKDWNRWLDNCHDWCISRQLWWGHRIPAYEVKSTHNTYWIAARSLDEANRFAQERHDVEDGEISQDPDVLDTWFSSSLLPFSSFGWPDKSEDIERFYPLDMMETGHDIMFFWVARMVMLGQQLTGRLPFKKVLLHGIICDEYGRKMSKSLGNVIKPEHIIKGISLDNLNRETEISHQQGTLSASELKKSLSGQKKMLPNGIPECGTDALRFTLCSANVKNHFINFNVQECHTNKLFFNKIWQATRYTLGCVERFNPPEKQLDKGCLTEMDRWILSRLGNTVEVFRTSLEAYNFHLGAAAWKTFFYNNFCDVYLETTKVNMNPQLLATASNHCRVLQYCLSLGLYHLEVFTPYLAAELRNHLPSVDLSFKPKDWIDLTLENEIAEILDICQHVRQAKSEFSPPIARKHDPVLHIFSKSDRLTEIIQRQMDNIQQLTLCKGVILNRTEAEFEKATYTAKSTASHLCAFGILTNQQPPVKLKTEQTMSSSDKKLLKLQKEMHKLLNVVNNEGYKKSANEIIQKKHLERIQQLRLQIEDMQKMVL
ncbi:valine--tRNA ligase [Malaya genurostris]|uniref:valine--tRNA ligase n=1 Tax=Malaya genurostris TaxID=325434 RepID=UPI0026F3B925|nr:valine--tRNA ligase [Malaya genurostris]